MGGKAPCIARTAKLDQITATLPFVGALLGSSNFAGARQAHRSVLGCDWAVAERYYDVREWRASEARTCGARLFDLTRDKLLKIPAFAWAYRNYQSARAWLEATEAWQIIRLMGRSVLAHLANWREKAFRNLSLQRGR